MEKAIFVSNLEKSKKGYDRLYFGAEFCQRLIPTKRDVKTAMKFAGDNGMQFTLVTPYVTDSGLDKLTKLFNILPDYTEVVFNDFGVLLALSEFNLKPVMGRALIKCKRDPRFGRIRRYLPEGAVDYLTHTSLSQRGTRTILKKFNVQRVELDNVPFKMDFSLNGFHGSLYVPYVYLSTTRLCMTNNYATGNFGILHCEKPCERYYFRLGSDNFPMALLLHGNALYYKNDKLVRHSGIDRTVHQVL